MSRVFQVLLFCSEMLIITILGLICCVYQYNPNLSITMTCLHVTTKIIREEDTWNDIAFISPITNNRYIFRRN